MELQLIMDAGSDSLGGTMWLTSSLSPTYQQLSPSRPGECESTAGQTSLVRQGAQTFLWQDKQLSPNASPEHLHQHRNHKQNPDSPISTSSQSSEHKLPVGSTDFHSPQSPQRLKRSADDSYQQQHLSTEPEKKIARKNGNSGSQGWSTQVEEFAEHLVADLDSSLSVLAASDLATAVASYNMSEALLALPSLTVFKQEALSPENQHNIISNNNNNNNNNGNNNNNNSNNNNNNNNNNVLNHVAQRSINGPALNNGSAGLAEADSNNNAQNPTNLHQLLYASNDEYPATSTSGNHVSSSQQGSEFSEDGRFQYVLAAATSIATKINEETLTYLNQGQSYEIKLKKLGDLSAYHGKALKSTIRICFHERRLQYTEREQILAWQRARPGERLLEVDVPLSYGIIDVCQSSASNNSVDFTWNPTKEVGCYVKINCISTEFTPKKHGGEKGVPFRIQVETRLPDGSRLHAASCQVKVFKLKGADRKHKQDRDKIQRRPPHEQDKYQPSYDCTVLTDIPLDSLSPSNSIGQNAGSPYASADVISSIPSSCETPSTPSPREVPPLLSSLSSSPTDDLENNREDIKANPALQAGVRPDQNHQENDLQQQQQQQQIDERCLTVLTAESNAAQKMFWLRARGFQAFEPTFTNFSASDILQLSRDDLIQICGLADGIRLFNALHAKELRPRLSLYCALETNTNHTLWRPVFLNNLTHGALASKLLETLKLSRDKLTSLIILGPRGIHVLVTNDLVANMRDESMFTVETINETGTDHFKLLLKPFPPQ